MDNATAPPGWLQRLLLDLLRKIGQRLHGAADTRARQHGWHVRVRHAGLSRSYRDPRFDLLAQRPDRDAGDCRAAADKTDGCTRGGR